MSRKKFRFLNIAAVVAALSAFLIFTYQVAPTASTDRKANLSTNGPKVDELRQKQVIDEVQLLLKNSRYAEAVEKLASTAKKWPRERNSIQIWQGIILYNDIQDYEKSLQVFAALYDSAPNKANVLLYLGASHIRLGNRYEGIAHLKKYVALSYEKRSNQPKTLYNTFLSYLAHKGSARLTIGQTYAFVGLEEMARAELSRIGDSWWRPVERATLIKILRKEAGFSKTTWTTGGVEERVAIARYVRYLHFGVH